MSLTPYLSNLFKCTLISFILSMSVVNSNANTNTNTKNEIEYVEEDTVPTLKESDAHLCFNKAYSEKDTR